MSDYAITVLVIGVLLAILLIGAVQIQLMKIKQENDPITKLFNAKKTNNKEKK